MVYAALTEGKTRRHLYHIQVVPLFLVHWLRGRGDSPHGAHVAHSTQSSRVFRRRSCRIAPLECHMEHLVDSFALLSTISRAGLEFLPFALFFYLRDFQRRRVAFILPPHCVPGRWWCLLFVKKRFQLSSLLLVYILLFVQRGIKNNLGRFSFELAVAWKTERLFEIESLSSFLCFP